MITEPLLAKLRALKLSGMLLSLAPAPLKPWLVTSLLPSSWPCSSTTSWNVGRRIS